MSRTLSKIDDIAGVDEDYCHSSLAVEYLLDIVREHLGMGGLRPLWGVENHGDFHSMMKKMYLLEYSSKKPTVESF